MISGVMASNLKVEKTTISDVVVKELTQPAKFIFNITNLGETDVFEIYTLIGIDLTPKGTFTINSGETSSIEVDVYLPESLRRNLGALTFSYKIRGQNTGDFEDNLKVKVVEFSELFELSAEDVEFGATDSQIILQNQEKATLNNLTIKLNSVFFNFSENEISVGNLEKLEFNPEINKDVTGLVAGKYLVTAEISSGNIATEITGNLKYVEKKDIASSEGLVGLLIVEKTIEKTNDGNVASIETIEVKKNIISRLFTSFNKEPNSVERDGFFVIYNWEKELNPAETFQVIVKTNWTIPFLIILFLVIIGFGLKLYLRKEVEISKKIIYVKTKGGEFALKVVLSIHAKKYIDNVKVIDRIPSLVKLHEKYKTLNPDRIDEKNRKLEWDLGSLNAGEHRVFSYVVYSKLNVVGRFSIPPANLIYLRNGKINETESNKVFFLNEMRKSYYN